MTGTRNEITNVLIQTVTPHITLVSEPPVKNRLQCHPLDGHLQDIRSWLAKSPQISLKKKNHHNTHTHLSTVCMVLSLVYVQEASQAEICDFHMVGVPHQNIPGCQISVDQSDILQVTHSL